MRIIKFLGFLSFFLMLSCTGNKPEKTVNDFFAALSNKDFEMAKSLATTKSQTTLNLLESGMEVSFGEGKLTNVDCVTENEIATCDCFMEGKEKPVPVTVVQENGEWKVDIQLTAKNMMNNFFDKLNGIDMSDLDLSGLDLENLDVEEIMKNIGGNVEEGTNQINDFIKNLDADKISESLKGIDSSLGETSGSLEDLINQIQDGMGKAE